MQTDELRINEDNWESFDLSEDEYIWTNSPKFRDCLDVHTDVHRFFDSILGGRSDWGGRYHTWLRDFGIDPESSNGWWSKDAVTTENIQCFVMDYIDDSFAERLDKLRDFIRKYDWLDMKAFRVSAPTIIDMLVKAEDKLESK